MAAPIPINGIAVNFGFVSASGLTIAGLVGTLLQSADHSSAADMEGARNGIGAYVVRGWYDTHDEAALEWVVTASSIANAITASSLTPVVAGTLITIANCDSLPELNGTTWEVQSGAKVSGSNTTFKKMSVTIHKRAGITAAAS